MCLMEVVGGMLYSGSFRMEVALSWLLHILSSVADLGGVRGVQMHPPLAASNVFLRT